MGTVKPKAPGGDVSQFAASILTESMTTRTCPTCDGTGEILIPGRSLNPFSGVTGRDPQRDETGSCPACLGDGIVRRTAA